MKCNYNKFDADKWAEAYLEQKLEQIGSDLVALRNLLELAYHTGRFEGEMERRSLLPGNINAIGTDKCGVDVQTIKQ